MTKSNVWDSFLSSDYAKTVTASKTVVAKGDENKHPDPKSAPGPLENVGWQAGNGKVPDTTKFHDLKEVAKEILDVAKKAPTGRVAATLAKLVRTAEAWEAQGKPELAPYVAELDSIIESTIAQHTPKA